MGIQKVSKKNCRTHLDALKLACVLNIRSSYGLQHNMSVHMQYCNLVWKTTFLKYIIFWEIAKCTVIYIYPSSWVNDLNMMGLGPIGRMELTATWKVEMHAQFACYKIIIGGRGRTMI